MRLPFLPQPKPRHNRKKAKDIPKPIRQFVKERDHNQCVVCGSPRSLQLHHLITKGRYDERLYNFKQGIHDPRNLATVCNPYHRRIHDDPAMMKKMLEWQRVRFGEVRVHGDQI
jgi:5-methylcytosine-specific restriction endonuclease McrA